MSTVMFVVGSGERAGAERVTMTLARGLGARGYRPVLCCLADGPFVDEVAASGLAMVRGRAIPRVRQLWALPGAAAEVAELARSVGATVVQGVGERACIVSGWGARRAGAVSVHWLHDAPLRSPGSAAVQALMALSPHQAVISPAAWMASAFHRSFRIAVSQIANGIELDALPDTAADARAIGGWDTDVVVVGHFARLQRWKGGDVFVRAAASVAARAPDARFLVVGGALYGWEQDYADGLPRLAAELGLGDRIRFLGHRDDALALMAGCDVVAHCSTRPEPFPTVVIEGMALGRAVVATRSRGPEELVRDRETGVLVNRGDVSSLADAIAGLVADRPRRAALGAAARAHVTRWLTADAMCDGFASLYASLGVAPGIPRPATGAG